MLNKFLMRLGSCWVGAVTILLGFLFIFMAKDQYGPGVNSVGMPVVGGILILFGIGLIIAALAGGFEKVADSKLKPSEINTSITLENQQRIQTVNHLDDNKEEIQQVNIKEGKSIIYITRSSKTIGLAQVFDVYVDNRTKIVLKNGQSTKIIASPGYHKIIIKVQQFSLCSDPFSFSLASGEAIYISCSTRFGRSPSIKQVSDYKK